MLRMQPWEIADMRSEVPLSLDDTGSVWGLTYNADKEVYEPPYTTKIKRTYLEIRSLASLSDPDLATFVQSINVSYEQYRQITIPYTTTLIRPDDQVRANGQVYQIVQIMQPDETDALDLILHCRKL